MTVTHAVTSTDANYTEPGSSGGMLPDGQASGAQTGRTAERMERGHTPACRKFRDEPSAVAGRCRRERRCGHSSGARRVVVGYERLDRRPVKSMSPLTGWQPVVGCRSDRPPRGWARAAPRPIARCPDTPA